MQEMVWNFDDTDDTKRFNYSLAAEIWLSIQPQRRRVSLGGGDKTDGSPDVSCRG